MIAMILDILFIIGLIMSGYDDYKYREISKKSLLFLVVVLALKVILFGLPNNIITYLSIFYILLVGGCGFGGGDIKILIFSFLFFNNPLIPLASTILSTFVCLLILRMKQDQDEVPFVLFFSLIISGIYLLTATLG